MVRQNWSNEEDTALLCIINNTTQPLNWPDIHAQLKRAGIAKTLKQTKTRWNNHLSPTVVKKNWSPEETRLLFQHYKQHKNKWKAISRHFKGRSDNCIKNHFFSVIRKSLRTATKLVGNEGLSCTALVKRIKPKVLADFLLAEFPVNEDNDKNGRNNDDANRHDDKGGKGDGGSGSKRYKVLDFIDKYAFADHNDLIYKNGALEKKLAASCIEFLLSMNEKYTGDSVRLKRIKKNKEGNCQKRGSFKKKAEEGESVVLFPATRETKETKDSIRNSNYKGNFGNSNNSNSYSYGNSKDNLEKRKTNGLEKLFPEQVVGYIRNMNELMRKITEPRSNELYDKDQHRREVVDSLCKLQKLLETTKPLVDQNSTNSQQNIKGLLKLYSSHKNSNNQLDFNLSHNSNLKDIERMLKEGSDLNANVSFKELSILRKTPNKSIIDCNSSFNNNNSKNDFFKPVRQSNVPLSNEFRAFEGSHNGSGVGVGSKRYSFVDKKQVNNFIEYCANVNEDSRDILPSPRKVPSNLRSFGKTNTYDYGDMFFDKLNRDGFK